MEKGYKSQIIFIEGILNTQRYWVSANGAFGHTIEQTVNFIDNEILFVKWPVN
jgi:hypothetical protein